MQVLPPDELAARAPLAHGLSALGAIARQHPTDRKRLVGPDVNYGRELLAALARTVGDGAHWEATTVRGIADELACAALQEGGLRTASDIELGALVNRALDEALAAGSVSPRFAALERSLGFRRALRDALMELRTAGVTPDEVRAGAELGSPAHDLPDVLERYERLLESARIVDPAGVFGLALESFDQETARVLDGAIVLATSLPARGLPRRLIDRLLTHGARLLPADPVVGLDVPPRMLAARAGVPALEPPAGQPQERGSMLSWVAAYELPDSGDPRLDAGAARVELYSAATPSEELRELCRRVIAEGLRWDDVEIVATDVDVYGIALDALGQRLGVAATMLHGVPFTRTRLGRALERWLSWLENGLPADVLRQALEAGELAAPAGASEPVAPTALARELRELKVGWGRARYEAALVRLESGKRVAELARKKDETDEELAARRELCARHCAALATLLRALLAAAPEVPERGSNRPARVSSAGLARATLAWLDLVPMHGTAEAETAVRLRSRLEEVAKVEGGGLFAGTMAALRDALADLRAWPAVRGHGLPWNAAAGMPHLTDVQHAGTTGRRRVFVVGLDADRTSGPVRQDPMMPDAARRAIAPGRLATSVERREESAYAMAAALASLRGRVTLSYATSGSLDGRDAGPSPLMLQAHRLARGDASLSYEQLGDALRPPASAVPGAGALLDARDVWLDALADGPLLLDGGDLVRAAFPMLAAGLRAQELAAGPHFTAHHGLVPAAVAATLDPTARPDREISPSSLEKLSACPLGWFYQYGLGLRAPDDPQYDVERWLDNRQRGSLLHELFETFARAYRGRQQEIAGDAARADVLRIADERIAHWRERVPPPGEAVFEAAAAEIREAALAFLQMERDLAGDGARWEQMEYAFGRGNPPKPYELPGGREIAVHGFADRIDVLADGTLRVVDYKTGKPSSYQKRPKDGPFSGGRRLQPALYAAAVGDLLGTPVSRFEYRFPTERGGNEVVAYDAAELEAARGVIGGLLDQVRAGAFVPTTDAKDCSYCDYQPVCRSSRAEFGDADSPRAAWAKAHAPDLDVYQLMRARRGQGGDE